MWVLVVMKYMTS